ncbi:hypothetical protein [uncultured Streptomyces sp.]|uniref:hypothetical protein n=1 Tax=uncultured Streptomyces sp. TaxID=174707 RepID=UPI002609D638|nr:hypothetical protein [uncultured Streptomyces sp.]
MVRWIAFWTAVWVGWGRLSRWTVDWLCNTKPASPEPAKEEAASAAATGESDEQPETEPGEQPSTPAPKRTRAAADGSAALRWAGLLLTALAVKALPETTTITLGAGAAWVLAAIALGYAAARSAKQAAVASDAAAEAEEAQPHPSQTMTLDQVAQVLHAVYTEGSGVHLAALADHLITDPPEGVPRAPWKSADVRTLMGRHGVRVRSGVRVPPIGGREGVHQQDFPPLPSPAPSDPPVAVVAPGQGANNNTNNTTVTRHHGGAQVTVTPPRQPAERT